MDREHAYEFGRVAAAKFAFVLRGTARHNPETFDEGKAWLDGVVDGLTELGRKSLEIHTSIAVAARLRAYCDDDLFYRGVRVTSDPVDHLRDTIEVIL